MTNLLAPVVFAQATACPEDDFLCNMIYDVTESAVLGNVIGRLFRIILILVVALVVHRVVRKLIKRFTQTMKEQGVAKLGELSTRGPLASTQPIDLQRATMRTETIGGVLRSVSAFVIWVIAALMILGAFEINLGPLIAGAGIVGIALGFGAQRLVQDFLSGIFMIIEDQYGVGDIVDAGEAVGEVEGVSLRTTRVRDLQGTLWHIPNGEIRRVGNYNQQWARAVLHIGVAYGTSIPHAWEVIQRTADGMAADPEWADMILERPEIWGVQDLANSEITIRLVMKVAPLKQFPIEREFRKRIKAAFDAEGIEIPFPQRTVWMRHEPERAPGSGDGSGAREREQAPHARRDPPSDV